jgi:membrane protein YdbS with pleckstrin-like domain
LIGMMQSFRSKIDPLIGLALVLGPIATIVGWLTAPPSQKVVALIGVVVFAVIYGGLVFPMRYLLTEQELVVRSGLVRQRIPYTEITRVTPTRNPLSSPALSLDRLRIERRSGRAIMISPDERDDFLRELALRARLVRHGDGLVR